MRSHTTHTFPVLQYGNLGLSSPKENWKVLFKSGALSLQARVSALFPSFISLALAMNGGYCVSIILLCVC